MRLETVDELTGRGKRPIDPRRIDDPSGDLRLVNREQGADSGSRKIFEKLGTVYPVASRDPEIDSGALPRRATEN